MKNEYSGKSALHSTGLKSDEDMVAMPPHPHRMCCGAVVGRAPCAHS